jgi:hypothetical protein
MKRIMSSILVILIVTMNFDIIGKAATFSNMLLSEKSNGNYVKYKEVKEANPKVTSCDRIPIYSDDSKSKDNIYDNSNLIIRGIVISKKEVGFIEYKKNKVYKTYYRELITIKVTRVIKQDKANLKTGIGAILSIYNEACSHKWFVNSIEIQKNKEYILFLRQASDENMIKYSAYGRYIINAPTWAVVLKDNDKYYYDKAFKQFAYVYESSIIRGNYIETTTYISSKFEDKLVYYIARLKKIPEKYKNLPVNFDSIENKYIKYMSVWGLNGTENIINSDEKKEGILSLLKTIKVGKDKYVVSNTSNPYDLGQTIYIEYKNGYKYSIETINIKKGMMYHVAYDLNYDSVSAGTYNIAPNIGEALKMVYAPKQALFKP